MLLSALQHPEVPPHTTALGQPRPSPTFTPGPPGGPEGGRTSEESQSPANWPPLFPGLPAASHLGQFMGSRTSSSQGCNSRPWSNWPQSALQPTYGPKEGSWPRGTAAAPAAPAIWHPGRAQAGMARSCPCSPSPASTVAKGVPSLLHGFLQALQV